MVGESQRYVRTGFCCRLRSLRRRVAVCKVSPSWSSSFSGRSGMRICRDLRSLKERSGATKNLSGGILESSNNRELVLLQSSVTIICPTCICRKSCGKVSLLSTEGLFILDSHKDLSMNRGQTLQYRTGNGLTWGLPTD